MGFSWDFLFDAHGFAQSAFSCDQKCLTFIAILSVVLMLGDRFRSISWERQASGTICFLFVLFHRQLIMYT